MIGFIGLGNMAQAIMGGILSNGVASEGDIIGYDPAISARNIVAEKYSIAMADSNQSVAEQADIVILAVKPQVLQKVIEEIAASASEDTLFISIAPGKSIEWITKLFGREVKIIRCMPNTPALVGAGMTGYCVSDKVTDEEKKTALSILDSIGRAQEVPEHLMSAVTVASGSSPAFIYMMIESLADGAVACGMPRQQAYRFVAQTVLGSAKMVLSTGKHPGQLKDEVCSPGGTTIAGVASLEESGFRSSLIGAALCVEQRCREMQGE